VEVASFDQAEQMALKHFKNLLDVRGHGKGMYLATPIRGAGG
jgi:hypothetical protein